MFETSIAGSLPKPGWLAETGKLWPRWGAEGEALARAKAAAAGADPDELIRIRTDTLTGAVRGACGACHTPPTPPLSKPPCPPGLSLALTWGPIRLRLAGPTAAGWT